MVGENVLAEKKTAKKEACVAGVLVVGVDKPRMRCVRSNVCATVFACCPPTLYSFELVAVAVLADTIFELVRCSRCFFT